VLADAHPTPVRNVVEENKRTREEERRIMKAILAAVLALSVLAGAAGTASALDDERFPNDFWTQQQRNLP
jgi:hypothetical protein